MTVAKRKIIVFLPLLFVVLSAFHVPTSWNSHSSSRLFSALNNVNWSRKSVLQLQKELRSRGLSIAGSKEDLIRRLENLNTIREKNQDREPTRMKAMWPKENEQRPTLPTNGRPRQQRWVREKEYSHYRDVEDLQDIPRHQERQEQQKWLEADLEQEARIENYLRMHKQQTIMEQQQQQRRRKYLVANDRRNRDPIMDATVEGHRIQHPQNEQEWLQRYYNQEYEEQHSGGKTDEIIDVHPRPSFQSFGGPRAANQDYIVAPKSTNTPPNNDQNNNNWNQARKKMESRQFLSIDKDDFLKPYDAAIETKSSDESGEDFYKAALEFETKQQKLLKEEDNFLEKIEKSSDSSGDLSAKQNNKDITDETLKDSKKDNGEGNDFFLGSQSENEKEPEANSVTDATWSRNEPYPFEVLGVAPGATMAEIKAAYRKKAMEYHPDKNPEDPGTAAETFRQLVDAFQVLSGGYKKGKYEKEYQMLQRLQKRQQQQTSMVEVATEEQEQKISKNLSTILPNHLYKKLEQRSASDKPSLLPIQNQSYQKILMGENVVLNAPSGSGKTLGYLLPLLARLPETKELNDELNTIQFEQKRGRHRRRNRRSRQSGKKHSQPCKPINLILVPSKEVAKKVGKVCSQYHQNSKNVGIVFGPQQSNLWRNAEWDTLVGTPLRIKELIEGGSLDLKRLQTVVWDEADVMLDPDVKSRVEDICIHLREGYQTILSSATMTEGVTEFCKEAMNLDPEDSNFITLCSDEGNLADMSHHSNPTILEPSITNLNQAEEEVSKANHWLIATSTSDQCMVAFDIIASLQPALCVVFVASSAEAEVVTKALSFSNQVQTSILHNGMPEDVRTQTLRSWRDVNYNSTCISNLLVTTDDVQLNNLDIPGVDLVLHFGIPRLSGNHELYDAKLYRSRSELMRQSRDSNAKEYDEILLYDYENEGRLLPGLQTELEIDHGIIMTPREPPVPQNVFESPYQHATGICYSFPQASLMVDNFKEKVANEVSEITDEGREQELVHRLAVALAALANQETPTK